MKLYKISSYGQFINESKQSKEEIDSICKKYGIEDYTINKDGTVDVDGNVPLYEKRLTKIPLKFGKITGYFICSRNQLTSLEGCPSEIGGDFYCSYNQLTSLEGCPTKVGGNFYCSHNQLTSLEGCPSEVGGHFYCSDNQLKDVKGFPRIIKGNISMSGNPVYEIFNLFPYDRWKEVPEFLNEYDVIRDGNKIILQSLELVYDELVLEVPENIEIKGYEII